MVSATVFAIAAVCAGLMGFAIQRGATCTVAAMDEVIRTHKTSRLLALIEASAWVASGLILARKFGWIAQLPTGYPISAWTAIGAMLLGLGAYVNRACVFGAIARLGSGEWAYIATPVGFYVGSVGFAWLPKATAREQIPVMSLGMPASAWTLWLVAAFIC